MKTSAPLKAFDLRTFWSKAEFAGGLFVCPHRVFYQTWNLCGHVVVAVV